MTSSGMIEPKYPCMQSYSTNDVTDASDSRDSYVFKKFINAAIYVEKTIKKIAPDLQNYEKNLADTIKVMKTKRCSCYIDSANCPCHPTMESGDGLKGTKSETQVNSKDFDYLENLRRLKNENTKKTIKKRPVQTKVSKQPNLPDGSISPKAVPSETNLVRSKSQMNWSLSDEIAGNVLENVEVEELAPKTQTIGEPYIKDQYSDNDSSSTASSSSTLTNCSQIKGTRSDKAFVYETKASRTSMTSFTPSENNNVRQWLSKKMEAEKKKLVAQREEERKKQMERERILERERENFRMWLAAKKKNEEKKKKEMKRQQYFDDLKELEKQKRNLENQIKYQVWLKRKKEADIEKKNQEQLKNMQEKIEKDLKSIANRKAFEDWLESSKNKPKPLPLNQGLDSLRSSLSVTYVNPIPWVPNIDPNSISK